VSVAVILAGVFSVLVAWRWAGAEMLAAQSLINLRKLEEGPLGAALGARGRSESWWKNARSEAAYTPILIPVYGRPNYLEQVLDSLRESDGPGAGHTVLIFGQHGSNPAVERLMAEAASWSPVLVIKAPLPLEARVSGQFPRDDAAVAANIRFLLWFAFARAGFADAIVLESDVTLSVDGYRFFRWGTRHMRLAASVQPRERSPRVRRGVRADEAAPMHGGPSAGAPPAGTEGVDAGRIFAVNGFHGRHHSLPPRSVSVSLGSGCDVDLSRCSGVECRAPEHIGGRDAHLDGMDFTSWGWATTRQVWEGPLASGWAMAWRNWDLEMETLRGQLGMAVLTPSLSRTRHIGMQGNNFGLRPSADAGPWLSLPMLQRGTPGPGLCVPSVPLPVLYRWAGRPATSDGSILSEWAVPPSDGPGGTRPPAGEPVNETAVEASGRLLEGLVRSGVVVAEPVVLAPYWSRFTAGAKALRDRMWKPFPADFPEWAASPPSQAQRPAPGVAEAWPAGQGREESR